MRAITYFLIYPEEPPFFTCLWTNKESLLNLNSSAIFLSTSLHSSNSPCPGIYMINRFLNLKATKPPFSGFQYIQRSTWTHRNQYNFPYCQLNWRSPRAYIVERLQKIGAKPQKKNSIKSLKQSPKSDEAKGEFNYRKKNYEEEL